MDFGLQWSVEMCLYSLCTKLVSIASSVFRTCELLCALTLQNVHGVHVYRPSRTVLGAVDRDSELIVDGGVPGSKRSTGHAGLVARNFRRSRSQYTIVQPGRFLVDSW